MIKHSAWLLLSALIFMADYVTKQWALTTLKAQPPVSITPFLRWIYVENTGAAFGILAESGDIGRLILLFVTIVITIILIVLLWRSQTIFLSVALSCMIGGAWGNLYERFSNGYVIDFIDVYWHQYHWPAFNIADMAISFGTFLFAIDLFFLQEKNPHDEKTADNIKP